MIGESILHYRITEKLGEGGMGIVYLAEDTKLERQVAIKFLPHHITANSDERKRFEIEAKAAAALNHPNIATVYNIEESEGEIFIVMEYIDGKELKEVVKTLHVTSQTSFEQTIDYAIHIAKGLQAAHEKGIVHRDIKSTNIMVTKKGDVKIMDFGLAKFRGSAQLTQIGTTVGTAAYMSPEQARGEDADQKADIWSFGVVLFEMLTGQLPFPGDYEQAVMYAILNEQPQPIQGLLPDIPSVLIHILDRTLDKDPSMRYQSMTDVLIELKRMQSGKGGSSTSMRSQTNIKVAAAADKKLKVKKRTAPLLMIIAIVAALAVVFNPFSSDDDSLPPMKMVPLTSFPGEEMQPAISPDGREVAFAWNGGSGVNYDIYVQIIGTLEPQKLTDNPMADTAPVWTPDGRSIMFTRFTPGLSNSIIGSIEIFLIPARGGTEKLLYKAGDIYPQHGDNTYDISKLGTEFVWWIFNKQFKLVTQDATAFAKTAIDTITAPPEDYLGDSDPAFSPSGKMLAFKRSKNDLGIGQITVMDYPRGESKMISEIYNIMGLSWMPNEEEIIFSSGGQLHRLNIESGEESTIALTSGVNASQPKVALKENTLVFTQTTRQPYNIYKFDLSNPNNEDFKPEPIFSSSLHEGNVKISPDGTKLAFFSNRTGEGQLWIGDLNTMNAAPIAKDINPKFSPSWSHDGTRLVYESIDGTEVINVSGGTAKRICKGAVMPSFSMDNKWIYLAANWDGDNQVWKVSVDGKDSVKVTTNGGEAGYESADGKWIYYSRTWTPGRNGVFRIPVEGGEEIIVIDQGVHRSGWILKEDGIYYLVAGYGKNEIFFYDFSTKETRKIFSNSFYKNINFDFSTDSKTLILSGQAMRESDIMMIENFR